MPEDLDARYRRILAQQLSMNPETWSALQRHGVTDATELRLQFFYAAPDRAKAEALKTVLADETDYDVAVESIGGMFRKQWTVTGMTQPTKVSLSVLDQWVDWMVTAGVHQGCDFDGWGAEV